VLTDIDIIVFGSSMNDCSRRSCISTEERVDDYLVFFVVYICTSII